jgi:hypothetical protein
MVYKDAAVRNAIEMGASDAAAAAAGGGGAAVAGAGRDGKVAGEGGEGGEGGRKIAEDKHHGFDFEWVELEESLDCLFPSRSQKPHAPLYSPRKTMGMKGIPGEEDAAAVLENLRRDAHQAMTVVRGGGRVSPSALHPPPSAHSIPQPRSQSLKCRPNPKPQTSNLVGGGRLG